MSVIEKVQRYIREHVLVRPGDRIAVAVSGGADSVALLRVLLELRGDLGIVLSVAHFNHRIRGAEADGDEQFVRALAADFELEFHSSSADVPAYSREHKLSLETAARELRQRWFGQLVQHGQADKIATAHTLDDQAETLLMRILRGTGSRGLTGIAPWQQEKYLIRPMLDVTRREVEEYLAHARQAWREDASNKDLHHTRNRIRHELLPLLEHSYNPALRQNLADLAEVARAEEEYWEKEVAGLLSRLVRPGKPSRSGRSSGPSEPHVLALELAPFQALPLAVQRRVLRAMTEQFDVALEYKHVQQLLDLIHGNKARQKQPGKELGLPGGLVAARSFRELQITFRENQAPPADYCYRLAVPGEVDVPELQTRIRAQLVSAGNSVSGYNFALLNRALLAPELTVRNWRPGDKFFPAHTRSPKKVKELLQPARLGHELSSAERKAWPVIESAGEIVWMRGFSVPEAYAAVASQGIVIEETRI
ncbi:MAG TPA: tRNA lysidine(34) synthetase TilS [Candidatus Angelobacter sp.]|nr:tRNA lysidine(34) synthetase TilS [Candidatus Angelobacter sp.]